MYKKYISLYFVLYIFFFIYFVNLVDRSEYNESIAIHSRQIRIHYHSRTNVLEVSLKNIYLNDYKMTISSATGYILGIFMIFALRAELRYELSCPSFSHSFT